ncbi:receptor-like protein kinase FERONIA [Prosopis cineraria]|uniref:receptor-like protein kinase FERONIA n=1 Tax=Prosopis cineraria TaxID=364024 RepID=UPI00240ECC81|nr:receptor-like protein kinase FERONIA [Prosopis cineraria]
MDITTTSFLAIILVLHGRFTVDGGGSNTYKAIDNILVNCGSSASVQLANRTWSPDINSQQLKIFENPPFSSVQANTSSLDNRPSLMKDLYITARLSRSEFTYSFLMLTDGPKFLRLYFYASSYSDFDRYSSFFSVKSGPFTLLKDFSPTADDDDDESDIITREYCINVPPGNLMLNVTFVPNTTVTSPDAYAFINGIEVVSMPTYLYYTKPSDHPGLPFVGRNTSYHIERTMALETMYRINVAGNQIPPDQDTGMFRNWLVEKQYLTQARPDKESHAAYFGDPQNLRYTKISNYTAPDRVYLTGRSYGVNEGSVTYNLTWEFEVDSQFYYMVRLHFCEIDFKFQKSGDRVFQIFIADHLAEPRADVVAWAEDILTPYYKDYAVGMGSKDQELKKLNLSIKLQPYDDGQISGYMDVILNGIEIFKISDANSNLGGPNPDRRLKPSPWTQSQKPKSSKKTIMISIIVGVASCFLVLSLVVFLISRRQSTRLKKSKSKSTHGSSSLPSGLCRCFSIAEIKAATNNFDDIFIIGVGGFGNVYKGYIDNDTLPVAIKRLKPGSQQGAHEFQTEIEMLSQLRHVHLVSLIGYCNEGDEMILVYEFMARGTVCEHLYGSDCDEPLSWKRRLKMCLDAARGLHYLHTGASHNIIHRDVKTTNILIDEKWVAKVSDFGLSKVGPMGMSRSHISTVVKGSVGYLDPEYYKRQRLTPKSDVYSFGVVLLEVLCGRPPLVRNVEKNKVSLVDWVKRCHHEGTIHQIVDSVVIGSITPECLKAFSDLALRCLVDDGNERPSMNDVVGSLEFAMELQESTEGRERICDQSGTQNEKEDVLIKRELVKDDEESEVRFTSSDGTLSESKSSGMTNSSSDKEALNSRMIFSELNNLTAR